MTLQTKCSNLLLGLRHRGNLNDNALRPYTSSVCPSCLGAQLPYAIGTLAACSLAMCGLRTCSRTDVDPPRVEPRVELPSAGRGISYRRPPPPGGGVNLLIRPHRVHAIDGPNHSRCRLGPICVGSRSHVLLHRGNLANTIDPSVRRRHRYR